MFEKIYSAVQCMMYIHSKVNNPFYFTLIKLLWITVSGQHETYVARSYCNHGSRINVHLLIVVVLG